MVAVVPSPQLLDVVWCSAIVIVVVVWCGGVVVVCSVIRVVQLQL